MRQRPLLFPFFFRYLRSYFMKQMKFKSIYSLLLIAAVLLISCDDTLKQIGYNIQPDNDQLSIATDTLSLGALTAEVDSVFSRTKYPVLGEYTDPMFGTIKGDFATEFFYPENLDFEAGASIDSVRLTVSYSSLIGDSLAPMSLEVYKLTDQLPRKRNYTNVNPAIFSDMTAPIGQQIFTGKNATSRIETYFVGTTPQQMVVYDIHVDLPNTIGENFLSFLNNYKESHEGKTPDIDAFNAFFPGLYVTTNFGYSTLLNINTTSLAVHYTHPVQEDSVTTKVFRLNSTPEVTLLNQISNDNSQLIIDNPTSTYIKSPSGVNTEITFPFSQIYPKIKSQALNQARLVIYAVPDAATDETVKLTPPDYLLLIHKDSLYVDDPAKNGFFEKRKLPDGKTSFIAAFNKSTYSYEFRNIASMVNHFNKLNDEPFDLTFCLVPIEAAYTTTQSSSYSTATQTLSAVYNLMKPTAVRIDKRPEKFKLEMIFSSY